MYFCFKNSSVVLHKNPAYLYYDFCIILKLNANALILNA